MAQYENKYDRLKNAVQLIAYDRNQLLGAAVDAILFGREGHPSTDQIGKLRGETLAPMKVCYYALVASGNDFDEANRLVGKYGK